MLTHLSLTPTFGLGDRLGLATPGHIAAVRGTKFAPIFAIAPGFFVGEQNRRLLLNEDGTLTARGQSIIAHTPMNRFGTPEDLLGATMWLISAAPSFVTGIVIPINGGFSAFSGVQRIIMQFGICIF